MSSRPSAVREPADDPEHPLTLRQVDQVRGDLYAVADEIEILKLQIASLPTRAYLSRLALMATGSVWVLIVAVALLLAR
jgi:hypothetical protein